MFRRARHLIALSLSLLLISAAAAISQPASATRLAGFLSELNGQGQAPQERERELQLVQEVVSQVLDNYVLALDPVRLVVAAIEGMSSAADGGRIIAERVGDAVRLQAGEASMALPLSRDGRMNRESVSTAYQFIRQKAPATPSKELAYGAIDGMLAQLDPHSSFMTPEVYKEMRLETQGTFGGLGIQVAVKDRQLTVVTPIAGTPADRAGIQPGDRIVRIDDMLTQQMTLMEAVQRLRGPAGRKVTLTILRQESPGPFQITLTREVIALKPVKLVTLEQSIGYIKIMSFSEQSGRDLQQAVQTLTEKVVKGVILDLRGNNGGLFNESIRAAELFLEEGQPVVSTASRHKNEAAQYKAAHAGALAKVPMIVLVNGGSASASEIVTAALQDLKRALIVGSKTYGKGSVQTIIPLKDGSALRLTTARYVTPGGRSIDGVGIQPDLVVRDQVEGGLSPKPVEVGPGPGKKRERSRLVRERGRIIAEDEGDPAVVIGRRDIVDLQKDQVLSLAWRALQATREPDVETLLGTARALLPAERGAGLDAPSGSRLPQ
ncbi:MAG: S41 family peptidase [candidate division NC10 bacterium]|nr:S41 family peptidase [candidate division NC10 bacterium]